MYRKQTGGFQGQTVEVTDGAQFNSLVHEHCQSLLLFQQQQQQQHTHTLLPI